MKANRCKNMPEPIQNKSVAAKSKKKQVTKN